MVKGKLKLLKEAIKSLFNPVTIGYPAGDPNLDYTEPHFGKDAKYSIVAEELRGKHKWDPEKCTGCGACSSCCSSSCLLYEDREDGKRHLWVHLGKCIFCSRCEYICPDEALDLTPEFELNYVGDRESEESFVRHDVELEVCGSCGHYVGPKLQVEKYSQRVLEEIHSAVKDAVKEDLDKTSKLCIDCRRKLAYELNLHTRKYY
ncbi:MAG: 4Fe-4S dicluster domain-containing protein [Candidatus Hodarchaeota archaeon]